MSTLAKLRRSSFRSQKAFSAHVVNLEGFYTVTPLRFHPKKTQRGSEKQLKFGDRLLHPWPAGFGCRTFTMSVHDGHLVSKMSVLHLCLRPPITPRRLISFNTHFVEVFCFPQGQECPPAII